MTLQSHNAERYRNSFPILYVTRNSLKPGSGQKRKQFICHFFNCSGNDLTNLRFRSNVNVVNSTMYDNECNRSVDTRGKRRRS